MKLSYIRVELYGKRVEHRLHLFKYFYNQRCEKNGMSHYVDAHTLGVL